MDPHGHIDDEDRSAIVARFEQVRGPSHEGGPPMYIISPNGRQGIDDATKSSSSNNDIVDPAAQTAFLSKDPAAWTPSFTTVLPEWVILTRVIALARKSRSFLLSKVTSFEQSAGWSAAFHETTNSFQAYSALLRIDSDFAVDEPSSSTGSDLGPVVVSSEKGSSSSSSSQLLSAYTTSMQKRYLGPKALRLKLYRNMRDAEEEQVLQDWRPVDALVERLRRDFGSLALFFYNHLCPDVIAILWRADVFSTHPFTVMASEYTQPSVSADWKADTMMMTNVDDVIREMSHSLDGMVTKVKLFQAPSPETRIVAASPSTSAKKRKHVKSQEEPEPAEKSSSSENDDSDDE